MDAFLALPEARRRALCEEAGQLLGLDAASVEKDFWVCWTLRELFALAEFGSTHLQGWHVALEGLEADRTLL